MQACAHINGPAVLAKCKYLRASVDAQAFRFKPERQSSPSHTLQCAPANSLKCTRTALKNSVYTYAHDLHDAMSHATAIRSHTSYETYFKVLNVPVI